MCNENKKEIILVRHSIFFKALCALLFCPLSLAVIWSRNFWKYFWVLLLVPFLVFVCILLYSFVFNTGFKLFYDYEGDDIRVVDDTEFLFHQKDYTESYKLNSGYYASHRILLIPESKFVPVEYEFRGEIYIEVYDKDHKLLHSVKVNDPAKIFRTGTEDYFPHYVLYKGPDKSFASSVFAFELGEIPFDLVRLKWDRLKSMEIRVTVLEPEESLLQYCDSASLVIIPDLIL